MVGGFVLFKNYKYVIKDEVVYKLLIQCCIITPPCDEQIECVSKFK